MVKYALPRQTSVTLRTKATRSASCASMNVLIRILDRRHWLTSECSPDHIGIEAEGIPVYGAVRFGDRRRFAVGNHYDLPHVFAFLARMR